MSGRSLSTGQSRLKWLAVIVLLVAVVCALWVNFGLRAPIEAHDDVVGLLIDYDELMRIADASYGIDFNDMVEEAVRAGATGLVVRERILSDWELAGDAIVFSGGQLRFQLENLYGEHYAEHMQGLSIHPDRTYILTRDYDVFNQIFSNLYAKERHPVTFELHGHYGIASTLHSVERGNLGMGYPIAQLEIAAAHDIQIIPRIRIWEPVTEDSLANAMYWVSQIPNLAAIGFNDSTVPGGGVDPYIQDLLADAIAPLNKPIVSFEFFDQRGLSGIANRLLDNGYLRVHAIGENELHRYTEFEDAANRYTLAAVERNIRYIYLRFQRLTNPGASLDRNMELIEYVVMRLESEGLRVGNPEPFEDSSVPFFAMLILGAGVLAGGGWLLSFLAEPFVKDKKWAIILVVVLLIALIGWAGGLVLAPAFIRKLFALASAIIFPSLAIILVLENLDKLTFNLSRGKHSNDSTPCPIRLMLRAIMQLLIMSILTLAGAMIMSALLAEPQFFLRLDNFVGVSISHVIPLGIVPVVLWAREKNWFGLLSGTVTSSVKFWQFGIALVLMGALALLMMRTGNDNPEVVLDIELRIRQILRDILGVRPRTTEFLIGHPLMLVMLYYGYKFKMFPILLAGIMGQVSLTNTYAHMHTPIVVSLLRSFHGLWFGIVIGIVIIVILELLSKCVKKLAAAQDQQALKQ
ncbi:MAG: DUF5693 family protein [Oscillospiraceae bacterium]|nr:DUF5693 family protein [Oscillospiraceae bacterium]